MQRSHHNSFDLMRFVLAAAVLVSHHYGLSGLAAPTIPFAGVSLGRFAVFAFFAVSGFLMYNSLSRTNDFYFYFSSRLLRIVPNLIVAVVTSSLVLMVIFHNYENVLSHLYYIRKDALSFIAKPSYWIEGIFTDRPDPGVNGSLWTLQYEFFMYIVIFLVFLLPRRVVGYALVLLVAIASLPALQNSDDTKRIATFHVDLGDLWKTGFHFLTGALIAHFWRFISARKAISVALAIVGIAALATFAPDRRSWMIALVWVPFFIVCLSPFASGFSRFGDASYGVYIYAFPIQQVSIITIQSFWGSMTVSFLVTVAVGYACWHGFEKRCLSKRHDIAGRWREFVQKIAAATKAAAMRSN
ncbi:acyltransferase family protein [Brucella anthropi]|uniref:acyltransferase family protein n=1 Tax=Brucella anthropi TaxID=529 RepID=UPI00124D756B|nr:acyltransferase [Brucella anthropi]KAB2752367.1 acyltransferase [Brucella anthropi]